MNDDAPSIGGFSRGFTIIETLIVLSITGALLASALLVFAGQQRKVEFNQSVRDIQSIIQKTINEVGAGYYPNGGNIQCSASGSTLTIAAGGSAQGSNTGCIFLGKAMQFGVSDTDPQEYHTFTVAGLQRNTGTIATANPEVVDLPVATTTATLRNGLRAVSMRYMVSGVPTNIGAVAFVSGLGTYNGGQLASGTQQMNLVPVDASGNVPVTLKATVVSAIKNRLGTSPVDPNGGVEICFASGSTAQSGLITIGGNGRNLSVKLDIKGTADCT